MLSLIFRIFIKLILLIVIFSCNEKHEQKVVETIVSHGKGKYGSGVLDTVPGHSADTSQTSLPSYSLEQLDNTKGLSNSSVNAIFQDSENLLWVGTWDGLNRYDG